MFVANGDTLIPLLYIHNTSDDSSRLETLNLFMSNRKRSNGGDISSWNVISTDSGLCSVQISYVDSSGNIIYQ